MATYMVLGSEIDNTLRDSQRSVSSAPVTSRGLQQLCTLAGILQDGKDGGLSFAKAFKQDLFVVLDSDGSSSSVCENSGGANSRIREDLNSGLSDPAALARSGKAVNVRADGTDYRVVVTRLSDGSMVVQGMRYSGLEHAIHKLLVWESAAGLALLGLLAVGSLTAARRRLSPLENMVETASAIAEGDLSRRIATARHGSSEVRQLSTALNAMLQQIETALTESERATAQLRHFLADASHELRTPLASVQGYLQLYEKGMLDADDKERALHRVSAEAKRMKPAGRRTARARPAGGAPRPGLPAGRRLRPGTGRCRRPRRAAARPPADTAAAGRRPDRVRPRRRGGAAAGRRQPAQQRAHPHPAGRAAGHRGRR